MNKKIFLLAIFLGLSFTFAQEFLNTTGVLELHVLDVGQGDAILLQTSEGHNILIDGGPDAKVLEALGRVLSPLDRKLDLVVMTHPDADHVTGLIPVLQRFQVDHVLLSAPEHDTEVFRAFLSEVIERDIAYTFASAVTDFQFGDLHLDTLWPLEAVTDQRVKVSNNVAVVIRATSMENSMLFTADIEAEVEEALLAALARGELELKADVLKAGHHGSRTSSTFDFLEAVKPELMIISCGTRNDYGHPHEETLERAEEFGIEVLRTDLEGTVSIDFF